MAILKAYQSASAADLDDDSSRAYPMSAFSRWMLIAASLTAAGVAHAGPIEPFWGDLDKATAQPEAQSPNMP